MFKNKSLYEATCLIFSPNGIIQEGTILTGKEWKKILVFEVGNGFEDIFKEIRK